MFRENKVLDFKAEDLLTKAKDIQLLRVTRDIQEYLRSGDEQRQMNEILMLEKQIQFYEKSHAQRVDEKKKALDKVKRQMKKLQSENERLEGRSQVPIELQEKLAFQGMSSIR